MRPIIGVMPLWDDEKESLWMLPGYLEGLRQAGGIPIILPMTTEGEELGRLAGLCDGFLFTGGHDVSPALYQEEPLEGLVSCCETRDRMEAFLLREALAGDKPLLGICRGLQFLNAALGGTLYQDLPTQRPTGTEHHQHAPYDVPAHRVTIRRQTPLHTCLGVDTLAVNSYHHQGIKTLAPELEAMAVSEDGLVEAIHMPTRRFVWAVQWHPEFSYQRDVHSARIFRAFLDALR